MSGAGDDRIPTAELAAEIVDGTIAVPVDLGAGPERVRVRILAERGPFVVTPLYRNARPAELEPAPTPLVVVTHKATGCRIGSSSCLDVAAALGWIDALLEAAASSLWATGELVDLRAAGIPIETENRLRLVLRNWPTSAVARVREVLERWKRESVGQLERRLELEDDLEGLRRNLGGRDLRR